MSLNKQNRFIDSILGLALGDAFGAPYEGAHEVCFITASYSVHCVNYGSRKDIFKQKKKFHQ